MPGFLKNIKNILSYKEPKPQPFELLEEEDEDQGSQNADENNSGRDQGENKNKSEAKKSSNESCDNTESEQSGSQSISKPQKGRNENGNISHDKQSISQKNSENRNESNGSDDKGKKNKNLLSLEEWNKSRGTKENKQNIIEQDGSKREQSGKSLKESTSKFVSSYIDINLQYIKQELNVEKNKQVILRELKIGRRKRALLVFILGIADRKVINESILKELMNPENFYEVDLNEDNAIDYIMDSVVPVNLVSRETQIDNAVKGILRGSVVLFVDGCNECIIMSAVSFQKRGVDTPQVETVIKGSHEAFTEDLMTNLSILRRIIKNKELVIDTFVIGKADSSRTSVIYLDKVVNKEIVKEVERRLKSLDIEIVPGGGVIEQLIEDEPFAIFPQILDTERPDRAASFILEGKVVIISDGTPFANVVPITLFHLLHTSEDYMLRWQYGTFLRMIRAGAFLIALYLPGVYVALTLFHQEMIPTELLTSIAQARESVPFPMPVELFFMESAFELIREAAIRVPGVIGQTLGIIGALILGDAAVSAGLVSPVLIIVVAVTGLANFAVPNYSLALSIRIIRFIYILLASIAGLYGIVVGTFIMGCLACSMKSFGVPFLTTVAPRTKRSPDIILRGPIWNLKQRPDFLNVANEKRKLKDPRGWVNSNNGDDNND